MEKDKPDPAPKPPRRAYVAPRVEESAPFEHLILSCARSTFADDCASPDDPSGLHS
jgi:hypothetical protein